jgi:hypothetical protein
MDNQGTSRKSGGGLTWFRFSLRALLVAVTLISGALAWVAYYRHWINERHRLTTWSFTQRVEWHYPDVDMIQPSWGLRLFREPAVPEVYFRLQEGESEATVDEFKRAFPECNVIVEHGHWT